MEDLKSAALMEDWRNYLWNTKGDIFEIIKRAIMVAASDHPTEFRTRRHEIVRTLFSSEFMMWRGCDNRKKHSPKMSNETEEETKTMATLKLKTETQFPNAKGPVTPENKDIGLGTRDSSQGVVEVRMKLKIVDHKSGDQSESESVCDLVTKLESMKLSMNTMEASEIGKSANPLKKHALKNVDQIARTLIKAWKSRVDESIKNQSSVDCGVEPTSQQVKPTNLNMNIERKLEGSEKVSKIGNGGVRDSLKKLETRKRKLQEEYKKVESVKKKRRIQVTSCMKSPSMAFFFPI